MREKKSPIQYTCSHNKTVITALCIAYKFQFHHIRPKQVITREPDRVLMFYGRNIDLFDKILFEAHTFIAVCLVFVRNKNHMRLPLLTGLGQSKSTDRHIGDERETWESLSVKNITKFVKLEDSCGN
ncbi:hypothetical protein KUTeg_017130 [Tegillarca granosa]|uniref:Uncharacterized protein n=1 Tax=Tegillarca granosa TaxID=220873 RepID=A0ABQ9ET65_TEGGR|nr:hypothetical protein KUTeg_017130 [Tegillarca granosa]